MRLLTQEILVALGNKKSMSSLRIKIPLVLMALFYKKEQNLNVWLGVHVCVGIWFVSLFCGVFCSLVLHWFQLTLKSMPTVEMKLPARKAPSLKRTSRQVFPTPESPTSITCSDTKTEKKTQHKIYTTRGGKGNSLTDRPVDEGISVK